MLTLLIVMCLATFSTGCTTTTQIRIQNISRLDFTEVSIAGQPYSDVAAGETGEYETVDLKFRYMVIRLKADGVKVNAQSLNMGSTRFTHRIDIKDLEAGHLAVDVIRD